MLLRTPSQLLSSTASVASHVLAMARLSRLDWPDSPGACLERQADMRRSRIAIKQDDLRLTWGQLNDLSNRVAAFARSKGLISGDCVALLADNSAIALAVIWGLNKLGIVTALINVQLSGEALRHVINGCSPCLVMADDEYLETIRELDLPASLEMMSLEHGDSHVASLTDALPACAGNPTETRHQRPQDVMMYLYTSGTTGLPKAAVIRNQRYLTTAHGFAGVVAQITDEDVIYLALPIYHATGILAAAGTALVSGAALALRKRFSAKAFWSDCVRYEATAFNYIGEICRYLLVADSNPFELAHRVRVILGAGMRSDIWEAFQERFRIPRIVEFYGATEGNIALINLENRPGMMGRMLPGQRVVRLDEEGEEFLFRNDGRLLEARVGEQGMLIGRISRATRFDGYLDAKRNAEKILKDPFGDGADYFNSGDLVTRHPGRWLSFADRLGDTYRWKGENISTIEVSNLFNGCSQVVESVAFGVTVPGHDGRAGMVAFVASDPLDINLLAVEVCKRIPTHLRPLFLRRCESLIRTASFKYQKGPLQKTGFDFGLTDDPLWVFNKSKGTYDMVTHEIISCIKDGSFKL